MKELPIWAKQSTLEDGFGRANILKVLMDVISSMLTTEVKPYFTKIGVPLFGRWT